MPAQVIIVGAGPVGLMLAGELRLGGVDVTVYERRTERSGESRGLGFTARATEVLAQRGLLDRFDGPVETSRQGHFGGIPMDFGILEGSHFGARGIPQFTVEEMLEGWATELGAVIRRGHEITGLESTADGVRVTGSIEDGADWLVACDGGRSTIRGLAGFDFPGSDATRECYLADVVGRDIRPRFIGERVAGGMVMSAPLGDGVDRIIVCPVGAPPPDGRRTLTFDHVADAWQELTGESLHGAEVRWFSAFTDATRQVTEYRRGRVLIAGDAAHVHLPAGGQGMSVGIQDAVNLGWKLAATVNGWAPDGLLDSYHAERHPVGERVLRNTLAQGTLYLSGSWINPLRGVFAELMEIPDVRRHLSGMVSGFDITYEGSGGRIAPSTVVGGTTVGELLRSGRGLLVGASADGWADRVDSVPGPFRALVRPDGYLAWSGEGDPDEALHRWFGAPVTVPVPA